MRKTITFADDREIREFVNVIRNGVDGFDYTKSSIVLHLEDLIQ